MSSYFFLIIGVTVMIRCNIYHDINALYLINEDGDPGIMPYRVGGCHHIFSDRWGVRCGMA